MTQDLERLLVRIDATTESLRRELRAADNAVAAHERKVQAAAFGIEKNFKRIGQAVGFYLSAQSIRELVRYSDTWKQLEGRLSTVSNGMDDVRRKEEALYAVSQRSRTGLEAVASLYTRLNQALTEQQRAQYNVIGITETFGKALAITGESAATAQGAIVQFAQAVASDFKASSQEINSLIDGAPRLAQVIAQELGLKAPAQLKKLAEAGELSTDRVLTAIQNASKIIESEFTKIPQTVDQSITQLDNAFLKYIGQSQIIVSGSSSLAAAISATADNFEQVADAAIIATGVLVGRMAPALLTSVGLWVNNTQQVILYQAALARMAGVSATAAAASTALNRAMGFLGGPIGIAITAVIAAMTLHTNQATEAQNRYNQAISDFKGKADDMRQASGDRRRQLVEDANAIINAHVRELESLNLLVEQYANYGNLGLFGDLAVGIQEGFGKLGIGDAPSEVIARVDSLRETIRKMRELLEEPLDNKSGKGGGFIGDAGKAAEDLQDSLDEMQRKIQRDLLKSGEDDIAQKVMDTQFALADLERQYGSFNRAQREQVKAILEGTRSLAEYEKATKEAEEAQKELERQQEAMAEAMNRPFENAARGIQEAFTDTFESIFDGSIDSAGDAANAIKRVFIRMAAELATLQIFGPQLAGLSIGGFGGSPAGSTGGGASSLASSGISLLGNASGVTGGISAAINGAAASALPSLFGMGAPIAGGVGPAAPGLLTGMGISASAALTGVGIALTAAQMLGAFSGPRPHPASTFGTEGLNFRNATLLSKHMDTSTAASMMGNLQQALGAMGAAGLDLDFIRGLQGGVDDGTGFYSFGDWSQRNPLDTVTFDPNDADNGLAQFLKLVLDASGDLSDVMDAELIPAMRELVTEGRSAEEVLTEIINALTRDDLRNAFLGELNTSLLEGVIPNVRQIQAEIERHNAALARANELGVSQTDILRLQELHQQRLKTITDNVGASAQQAARQASELARRFTSVSGGLDNILFGLRYGSNAPRTPVSNLEELRRLVETTGAAAQLGDVDAQEELLRLIPAFVELSGQVNQFGPLFEQDRQMAERLASLTKDVADRQIELQTRIAEATEQTAGALSRSGGGGGGNANDRLRALISAGLINDQTARSIIFSTGFNGVVGNGNVDRFFGSNAGANALANRAIDALGFQGYASGGLVTGGTAGRDSVPAMLMPGEYVVNASAVRRIGVGNLQAMNAGNDNMAGEIRALRQDMNRLISVVAASGTEQVAQLQGIRSATAKQANIAELQAVARK